MSSLTVPGSVQGSQPFRRHGLGGWPSRLLEFLLSPACAGCGGSLPSLRQGSPTPPRICHGCLSRLKGPAHPRCSRCHAPRGTGLPEDRPCPECHKWPPVLVAARSAVVLAPPADKLVHALKYGGWPDLATTLADRMIEATRHTLDLTEGSVIAPIPTTPGRLRTRGYDQARLLALGVVERAGGTLVDALERRPGGVSQVALHPRERRANVDGVFSIRPGAESLIGGKHLVLVDDVLTTGATASAAATALEKGGAASVRLLTFARSLPEIG